MEVKALLLRWNQWLWAEAGLHDLHPSPVSPEHATASAFGGRRADADRWRGSVRGVNRGARAISSTCLPAIVRAPSDGDAHRHRATGATASVASCAGRAFGRNRRPHPLFLSCDPGGLASSSPGGGSVLGLPVDDLMMMSAVWSWNRMPQRGTISWPVDAGVASDAKTQLTA